MITPSIASSLRTAAHAAADEARRVILPYFRTQGLTAENKAADGFDPVTLADRAAEQAMRKVLQSLRPMDAVLGEEFGRSDALDDPSGLTWVLDPIDGTRGFISGTPTWGVLIAACTDEGPVYGLIDQPYTGERFEGGLGQAQLTHGGDVTPLRTSAVADLAAATIFTTFPEVGTPAEGAAFAALAQQCRLTRYGMDCYAYALLAAGHIDLVVEAGLNSYDIAGPIAVIEAAGGIVTDWQGGPAWQGGRVLAAANRQVHAQALAVLRDQMKG